MGGEWRVQFDAEVSFTNGGGLRAEGFRLTGRAVLLHTGADRTLITGDGADWLVAEGAALVGIDSDALGATCRPQASRSCTALRGLDALPPNGFWFVAVPLRTYGLTPSRSASSP